jgi:hypothetical protein
MTAFALCPKCGGVPEWNERLGVFVCHPCNLVVTPDPSLICVSAVSPDVRCGPASASGLPALAGSRAVLSVYVA